MSGRKKEVDGPHQYTRGSFQNGWRRLWSVHTTTNTLHDIPKPFMPSVERSHNIPWGMYTILLWLRQTGLSGFEFSLQDAINKVCSVSKLTVHTQMVIYFQGAQLYMELEFQFHIITILLCLFSIFLFHSKAASGTELDTRQLDRPTQIVLYITYTFAAPSPHYQHPGSKAHTGLEALQNGPLCEPSPIIIMPMTFKLFNPSKDSLCCVALKQKNG